MEKAKIIPEIRLRNGFSDRLNPPKEILQITDLDYRARMYLLNTIKAYLKQMEEDNYSCNENQLTVLVNHVLANVYVEEIDYSIKHYNREWFEENFIKPTIINDTLNHVFDLVEYLCYDISLIRGGSKVVADINQVLRNEKVAYRFVIDKIIPITNEQEMESIKDVISKNPYDTSVKHFEKAFELFSNREKPDYSNCIKESISAVEAVCQVIIENNKATLGDALKALKDSGIKIHPAMETAFSKLYGYTSDSDGIRHANGIGEKDATFDEAKFMLVTCSAFVNYLIAEYEKVKTGKTNK